MNEPIYFQLFKIYNADISKKLIKLAELRETFDSIGGFDNGERVMSSHEQDKIGKLIAQVVDLERDIMSSTSDFKIIQTEILAMIAKMPSGKDKEVMMRTYSMQETDEMIGKKMNISKRYVRKLRQKGVESLSE